MFRRLALTAQLQLHKPPYPSGLSYLGKLAAVAAVGLVLASATTAGAQPVEPPEGLVSWWPGDGNARDVIGTNDGLLKGGASFRRIWGISG